MTVVSKGKITSKLSDLVREGCITEISSVFRPDSLTECDRRLLYHCKNKQTFHKSKMLHNKAITDKWIDLLSTTKGVRVVEKNVVVADANCNINGVIDIIVDFQDKIFVVKVKNIDSLVFDKIKTNGPRRKDVFEVQAYIWLSELEEGLLVYEDIGDQRFDILHIEKSKEIIKSIEAKFGDLVRYQVSGRMPKKPENISREYCESCEYHKICSESLSSK